MFAAQNGPLTQLRFGSTDNGELAITCGARRTLLSATAVSVRVNTSRWSTTSPHLDRDAELRDRLSRLFEVDQAILHNLSIMLFWCATLEADRPGQVVIAGSDNYRLVFNTDYDQHGDRHIIATLYGDGQERIVTELCPVKALALLTLLEKRQLAPIWDPHATKNFEAKMVINSDNVDQQVCNGQVSVWQNAQALTFVIESESGSMLATYSLRTTDYERARACTIDSAICAVDDAITGDLLHECPIMGDSHEVLSLHNKGGSALLHMNDSDNNRLTVKMKDGEKFLNLLKSALESLQALVEAQREQFDGPPF